MFNYKRFNIEYANAISDTVVQWNANPFREFLRSWPNCFRIMIPEEDGKLLELACRLAPLTDASRYAKRLAAERLARI